MVDRITQEIEYWIDDSYMDDDDKETVSNWHDLLEALDMTASEARTNIIEALDADVWDRILNHQTTQGFNDLQFDEDGTFEDENGNFLKYGEVMKLVKQELVNRKVLKVAR